jgi:hypothetical protein
MSRPDVPTLVAGLTVAALGVLLLADDLGGVDLRFGLVAPACLAVLGAILLASGLSRRP